MRIGLDLDGVIAVTPFGRLAVKAPRPVAGLPDGYERSYDTRPPSSPLRTAIEWLRFAWRDVAPDAEDVLRTLSASHELYIITGRSMIGERIATRWLRAKRLDAHIAGLNMSPPGLRPPQHKLAAALGLKLGAHIDDDPRTAYHLARNGVPRVFLLTHRGDYHDAPPNLTVVGSLREFAAEVSNQ